MRLPFVGSAVPYPLFIGLAVVTSGALHAREAIRRGIPVWRLGLVLLVLAAGALAGAVTYNSVETSALDRFGRSAFLSGGYRWPGALLAMLLLLPLVRSLLPRGVGVAAYLDLLAVPAAVGLAVVRLGCLSMGCCYGTPTTLLWALRFPPTSQAARQHAVNGWVEPGAWSLPVHPLQVYFALASIAVAIVLTRWRRRQRWDGQLFLLFLALHEGAKGGLEFIRGSLVGHSVVHLRLVSLSVSAAAFAALVILARRRAPMHAEPARRALRLP